MSTLFWLTKAQMAHHHSSFLKSHGRPRFDDLQLLNGIILINHKGLRWCGAPREYGLAKTL